MIGNLTKRRSQQLHGNDYTHTDHSFSDHDECLLRECSSFSPTQMFLLTSWSRINEWMIVVFFYTLLWLGFWNILTFYMFVNVPVWRDMTYAIVGLALLSLSEFFFSPSNKHSLMVEDWEKGKPSGFSWKRKCNNFLRMACNQCGYIIFWTGIWDLFDVFLIERTFWRDFVYGVIALVALFFLEELSSFESLVWLLTEIQSFFGPPSEQDIELGDQTDLEPHTDGEGGHQTEETGETIIDMQ